MAFASNKNPFGRRRVTRSGRATMSSTRRNVKRRAEGMTKFGYNFDVLTPKEGYSSDVLPYNEYGYTPPSLPAPPENCVYVFDNMGNATLKCSDAPIDAYVSSPVETAPLPSSYASFNFPNWNTLTCEEIQKYIMAIEQEMTYIRVTPDVYAIYTKQLDYARTLLSEKCKKPVDLELGLGDTGGIKVIKDTLVDVPTPIDAELGTGTGVPVVTTETPVTTTPLPPVSGAEPVGQAPFKFQWWWAVAAGVGLYLITKSNK